MIPAVITRLGRARSLFGLIALLSTWTLADAQSRSLAVLNELQTRAERTNFTETSRYDDVIAFLDIVDQASSLVHVTSFGYSFEGRPLPLAVVGRVSDARPAAVRGTGRPRVDRPSHY